MTATATHAPGTFCWLDLAAHDNDAARAFYTGLFGWTVDDRRYGEGPDDVYTMYRLDGRDVAASYTMDEAQRAQGFAPAWLSYVAVESADAAAARAAELGGTVAATPFDVMESGRMALVTDPGGALLALWEPRAHPGVGLRDQAGALVWNDLGTHDLPAARRFYTELFGWGTHEMSGGGGMPYVILMLGEKGVGGMYAIPPEMGMEMPSGWTPYFAVDDADASMERARELGATVLMEPHDVPEAGRMVLIRDPQGALFYLLKPAPPQQG